MDALLARPRRPGWARASFALLLLPSLLGCRGAPDAERAVDRPNVVLILIDDLRPDLGTYGHPLVQSPHIDRLAARGLRFDRAYSQFPLCNPSRTSLLTGLRPDTTGIIDNRVPFRSQLSDAVTLPRLFRQHGYTTISVGKIFHGSGRRGGGRRLKWMDLRAWDVEHYPARRRRSPTDRGDTLAGQVGRYRWQASSLDGEDLADGGVARLAVEALEASTDRPLFLAVGFSKPHAPYVAPSTYFELYPMDTITPPGRPPDGFTEQQHKDLLRAYWACVSFVDAQVGRILEALDRLELWGNTVVVLASDHGYHLGEQGWWSKNTLFEASARVPLIVASPEMRASGTSSARLVELVDLYPTLVDLAGLKPPVGLEGTSLHPLLDEPELDWKEGAYTQTLRGRVEGRSVRTERWRYTEWDEGRQGVELYDHHSDSEESLNLADDPEFEPVRHRLRQLLRGPRR